MFTRGAGIKYCKILAKDISFPYSDSIVCPGTDLFAQFDFHHLVYTSTSLSVR